MLNIEEAFIRSVDTSPEKVIFVASNKQLADLACSCKDPPKVFIIDVDPTNNIGPSYLTLTTYR